MSGFNTIIGSGSFSATPPPPFLLWHIVEHQTQMDG